MPNQAIKMRRPAPRTFGKQPTPQEKIINTMTKFGAPGIAKQQGSTIVKYDILPLLTGTASNTYTFFQDAQTRQFPFTNLTDGKLQVGEAIALERMYFFIMTKDKATGAITNVQTLEEFGILGSYGSVFNFMIANNQVVKPSPLFSFRSSFNKNATYEEYNVFHFDTLITIPELIEFAVNLKTPVITVAGSETLDFFIGCAIEGTGAILAPRSTF